MPRHLTAEMIAELGEPVVRPFFGAELMFDDDPARANSTPVDVTIDDFLFPGVGALGSIGPVQENGETQANAISIGLTAVNRAYVSITMNAQYQGRRGTLWYGLMTSTYAVVSRPVIAFRGRIDTLDIEMGELATITATIESRMADWSRARGGRYTDEEQKMRYPGDEGLSFVAQTTQAQILWGSGTTTQPAVVQQGGGGAKK